MVKMVKMLASAMAVIMTMHMAVIMTIIMTMMALGMRQVEPR